MCLALLFAISPLTASPIYSKFMSPLPERVDQASFICIGTVDGLKQVPRPQGIVSDRASGVDWIPEVLDLARIRVEQVLKGDRTTASVNLEAWPTWTCDSTHVEVGEKYMLLLAPGQVSKMPDDQRESVECSVKGPILQNVLSGDGIIPIRDSAFGRVAWCWPVPSQLRVVAGDDVHTADEMLGCKLDATIDYVRTLATFAPELVTIRATHRAQDGGFELRILPDGRRRFLRYEGDAERIELDQIAPSRWASMQFALDTLLQDANLDLDVKELGLERELVYKGARYSLIFCEPYSWLNRYAQSTQEPRERLPLLPTALKAWAEVRSWVECDSCIDVREADRKRIAELERR